MSRRVDELRSRRELLVAQSAVQREALRLDAAVIGQTLQTADRAVSLARRLARSPLVITVAVVGLIVFRRHPVAAWAMRGVALAGTARRVGRTLRHLAEAEPAGQPGDS